jgi:acid phosphatase type 7
MPWSFLNRPGRPCGRAWSLAAIGLCLLVNACSVGAPPVAQPPAQTATVSVTVQPSQTPASIASATRGPTLNPAGTLTPTGTPEPPPSPQPSPVVLIAAGDIASCASDGDEATALLVQAIEGTVATLGDSVYEHGSAEQFAQCYAPTWGRVKDRTRPAVGNHEYLTAGAAPYFEYFGPAAGLPGQGYYSYDLGVWHVVVLNSICWEAGGCGRDAPQAIWLAADLAAHPTACTLAYWHVPRFSSGYHGNADFVQVLWDVLHAAGADVVLNGHDHDYERFAPQDPHGNPDAERGLREFVVGTGGRGHYAFPDGPEPNSEVRDATTYGVLKLTLAADHYAWEFVPVAGGTFTDAGEAACHP